jgi:lysophospholipase L1-like esterase
MDAILCFGDSITFGVGEMPTKGWVGRLKDYFEVKDQYNAVYNFGFCGHTSNDLLIRFETELKTRARIKRPTDHFTIIVAIGTNDSRIRDNKEEISLPKFQNNIKKLIGISKKYSKDIIFLSLTPVNDKIAEIFDGNTSFSNERILKFNNLIKESCKTNTILFLDLFNPMKKEEHLKLLKDGLHPNSKGYNLMSQKIKKLGQKHKLF